MAAFTFATVASSATCTGWCVSGQARIATSEASTMSVLRLEQRMLRVRPELYRRAATGRTLALEILVDVTGPWTKLHGYDRRSLRDPVTVSASRSDAAMVDVDFSP